MQYDLLSLLVIMSKAVFCELLVVQFLVLVVVDCVAYIYTYIVWEVCLLAFIIDNGRVFINSPFIIKIRVIILVFFFKRHLKQVLPKRTGLV